MTTIPATTLSRQLFKGSLEFNWVLTFVVALYLAVAIVEFLIIVLAAPSITEIGSLYVTVP